MRLFFQTKAICYFSSLEATKASCYIHCVSASWNVLCLSIFSLQGHQHNRGTGILAIFERPKRMKLATISLSTAAQQSKYESDQNTPFEKILDDRPVQDADILPVLLLYDGFGGFQDIVDGVTDVTINHVLGLSEVQR